jgi:hypothetical protein
MKIELHGMVKKASGEWDGLVFKKVYGKTVAFAKPTVTTEPTDKQLAQREQFKQAAMYAKAALADPALRPLYAAAAYAKDVPVVAVAVQDYFNPPTIDEVRLSAYKGRVGDRIDVFAHDDFGVANVYVTIKGANGTVIENGPAVAGSSADGSVHWSYAATTLVQPGTTVTVQANAADHPGTTVTASQSKAL